jgi:hypothetical protein
MVASWMRDAEWRNFAAHAAVNFGAKRWDARLVTGSFWRIADDGFQSKSN